MFLPLALSFALAVDALNFPYEAVQLTDSDIGNFSAIAFADAHHASATYTGPHCKIEPSDLGWPTETEWAKLNTTLGGQLLKPVPPGAVCYPGPYFNQSKCEFLLGPVNTTRFYSDHPVNVFTTWPEGDTCLPSLNPIGNCTQGGFPTYVVNATSVRDIQMAVNFARNKNIRFNIKNTGHDFVGRSTGHGSLSVWVHYLKGIELVSDYSIGRYRGPAVRVGAGIETWEAYNYMNSTGQKINFVVSGAPQLAIAGGWSQGGGHSNVASFYGLGADQLLSFNVVTADGRFITASPEENQDLFFAMRGGAGGTYGIITSAIFKGYTGPLIYGGVSYSFATGPINPGNLTSNSPFKGAPTIRIPDLDTFWRAFGVYLNFSKTASEVGGFGFGDLASIGNSSFTFTSSFIMPNMTDAEAATFLRPLFVSFRAAGVNITDLPMATATYARTQSGSGDVPFDRLFASRLFPRANWANETLFLQTVAATRRTVEEGRFVFRTRAFAPTVKVAGYPGESAAVGPAFRDSLVHATVFDPLSVTAQTTAAEWLSRHDNLNRYMNMLRAVTPGSGAYINEADVLEPDWQQSFFGRNYARLKTIKKEVDPWGLFWAPTTPGSEAWEVVTANGLPTQNGLLCRTGL